MDTNPYKAPVSPPAPRSRLRSFFDITAAICAVSPIVFFATVIVIFITAPSLNPTDLVLNTILSVCGGLWLISGGYNLIGVFRSRRRWPLIGIVLNVLSLLLWGFIFIMAFLTPA
jgi:hypothetical protein